MRKIDLKPVLGATFAAAVFCAGPAFGGEGPEAAPTYIFFDFGKPSLSRDAEASLTEIVASVGDKAGVIVEVAGFSDTAGPENANKSIALKRAVVVRDFLRARGVSTDAIRIAANGERQLLTPTADGVREAQNRRVEVRVVPRGSR